MEVKDAIKYVTSAPKKVGAAITAAPKKIQQGAQNLAKLPTEVYERADKGVHQVANQANKLKAMAIKNGNFVGPKRPTSTSAPQASIQLKTPAQRQPIGFDKHNGGGFQNTGYEKTYKTEAEAQKAFDSAKTKLLNPDQWDLVGPDMLAPKWELLGLDGSKVDSKRPAQKGDYLHIDAPGPDFYVQIDRAHVGKDLVQLSVVPSKNPNSNNSKVQHFFSSDSSRGFSLERDKNTVRFVTEGRNEHLNMVSEAGVESPINAAAGLSIMGGGGNSYWEYFAPTILK